MNDATDGYIRQALKNWAAEQQPPANGRARLLLVAASPSAQWAKSERKQDASLDYIKPNYSPSNPAIELYNLPLLFAVQMTYMTLRRVT